MKTLKALLNSALLWGALYLLAIPVFASIFQYNLPAGSFFHATLPHEPLVQMRSRMILEKIWDDYSHFGPRTDGECEPVSPQIRSTDLTSLSVEGDDISFSANYYLGNWPRSYQVRPRIHFSLERNFDVPYRLPPGKGRGTVFKELRIDGIESSPWRETSHVLIARCLFPTLYDEKLPKNVVLLGLAVPINDELIELAGDLRGVPVTKRGGLPRMFYLSATTITTTGFGDIVPLTNRARLFVTSESIVGVILLGLFLNALANRLSRRS